MGEASRLEWLIIGGGVHGLHIAHVLINRCALPRARLRLLDPHPIPLARWTRLTANTGMTFLRSPSVHNLDLQTDGLDLFAHTPSGRPYAGFCNPYHRPALLLFQAHVDHLVKQQRLDELWIKGIATHLREIPGGWLVETDGGALTTRRILLAIGRTQPQWPEWALTVRAKWSDAPIHHLFEDGFELMARPTSGHTVVVGGGITAAQVACTLAGRPGLRHPVTLLLRHPLRTAQFDSDPCWNGPKCLKEFQHTDDYSVRRQQIRAGRRRGSLPPDVMRELHQRLASGEVQIQQDQVAAAHTNEQGQINLRLTSGASITAVHVLLATGFDPARPGGALVERAIDDYGLPCALCGYPLLDRQLSWHSGLYVSGALAELELGATAPNIHGARMAADRLSSLI